MGLYYIPRDDYLMHHGVKGMKWGVRNDYQPTGRRRASGLTTAQDVNKKRGLTKGQKIALGIGAGALATAAVAGGGYALYKTGAAKSAAKLGSSLLKSALKGSKSVASKSAARIGTSKVTNASSKPLLLTDNSMGGKIKGAAKEVVKAKIKDTAYLAKTGLRDAKINAGIAIRTGAKKAPGVVRDLAKSTVKGTWMGIKDTYSTYTNPAEVSKLVSAGLKKGIAGASISAISGAVATAGNAAISGREPTRAEAASNMKYKPNKK